MIFEIFHPEIFVHEKCHFSRHFRHRKSVDFEVRGSPPAISKSGVRGPPENEKSEVRDPRFSLFGVPRPRFSENHVIFQKNGSRTPDFEFLDRKSLIFGSKISKSGVPGEKVARFSEDKLGRIAVLLADFSTHFWPDRGSPPRNR